MAKGANLSEEWHLFADEFQDGGTRGRTDVWDWTCKPCDGTAVHQNRPCRACGGRGHVERVDKPAIEVTIPAGCRTGQKLRVRGYGWHGVPNTPENRGDLIITLRLFADGEIRDELDAAPAQALPPARARALPAGARALPGARVP